MLYIETSNQQPPELKEEIQILVDHAVSSCE